MRSLLRVVYEPAEQERLVHAWGRAIIAGETSGDDPDFWGFFSEATIAFKDKSYAEEDEWRLVQFGRISDPRGIGLLQPIQFRERRGEVVPYFAIDLSQSAAYPGRLPISSIVYGPTQDQERSGKALRLLIESRGYNAGQVKLRPSKVPFNR
jgi:hypothetical protein